MIVTRREAADHQLDTAIELQMKNGNLPSIFTLANAASMLLSDLAEDDNRSQSFTRDLATSFGITVRELLRVLREKPNLLKHFDRNRTPTIELSREEADELITYTALARASLNSEQDRFTKNQLIFFYWFVILNRDRIAEIFSGDQLNEIVMRANDLFGDLPDSKDASRPLAWGRAEARWNQRALA